MKLLTTKEAAAQLGTTDRTVRRWCKLKLLPYISLGRDYGIDPEKLKKFKPPTRGNPLFGKHFGNGKKKSRRK